MYGSLTFTDRADTSGLSSFILVYGMLSDFIAFVSFCHMVCFLCFIFVYMSSDNLESCVFDSVAIFIIILQCDTLKSCFFRQCSFSPYYK